MGERDGSCDQREWKECERIQRWSHLFNYQERFYLKKICLKQKRRKIAIKMVLIFFTFT